MTDDGPTFELVPIARLRGHERHEPGKVDELVAELRRTGRFVDPIWVARDSWVILNGHHRVEALRRLGLKRIPAWVFDYHGEDVDLDRWSPGPPIDKSEVVARARGGRPFPPKTTRHRLRIELPARSVPLSELAS
jgi:L-serine kinase (ADP)